MVSVSKRPLIIVESPTKAKTISRFMKSRYQVKASLGHVRDLPRSKLGVDVGHDFEPEYINIRGKGDIIKELKEAAKGASKVYLATDPDREGEAISWHLCAILGIDPTQAQRVTFHEITEKAVKEAFAHPLPLNLKLIDAQQARRVLDRLVGYSLSPLLWHKIRPGLSAGRVQSPALRLVVARENELNAFKPEEYWTLDAYLQGRNGDVRARYYGEGRKKIDLRTEDQVAAILADVREMPFRVLSVTPKERRKSPSFPFTTSTLQQEASRKLGFPVSKTMAVAQTLYEGVELGEEGYTGLITYMRTDSTRVSPVAVAEAREFIVSAYGPDYVGAARKDKARPGQQDAHEAVRPTSVWKSPDQVKKYVKPDQFKLYKLIWERFVSSQMAPAVYDTVTCDVECGKHLFRATGSRLKFAGFTKLYEEGQDSPSEEDKEIIPLVPGEQLRLLRTDPLQHFTEPPPRYTEASLVKALEENGIGRPSTYAPIIATLFDREYIGRETRRLFPTDLGVLVDTLLTEYFPSVVDLRFTAGMEKRLDSVEEGEENWVTVIREFWEPFKDQVEKAEKQVGRLKVEDEPAGETCPKCGRPMVIKHGRFGRFIACSGYPECKTTKPLLAKTGALCPKCGGDIVARRTKRGRTFYGCANYPTCDFLSWDRPVPDAKCPSCGSFLVEAGGKVKTYRCSKPGCQFHTQNLANIEK
ncbi:MAG: type I DNA topoisomerase [Bacillota bacterium]